MKIEGSKDLVQLDGAPDVPAFERAKPGRGFKGKPRSGKWGANRPDRNSDRAPRKEKSKSDTGNPSEPRAKARSDEPGSHRGRVPAAPARNDTPHGTFSAKSASAKKNKSRPAASKDGKPKSGGKAVKGPPPPKGKPNSKKNRARAAAKAGKGGDAMPKRRKS